MNNTPEFHSTDPAEMRRIETWCAEHVLGWQRSEGAGFHGDLDWWRGSPGRVCVVNWHPLTDANADVAVLQYVRENWPREKFHHFQGAFVELGNEDPCHYDIGDYCRAACITKSENKP